MTTSKAITSIRIATLFWLEPAKGAIDFFLKINILPLMEHLEHQRTSNIIGDDERMLLVKETGDDRYLRPLIYEYERWLYSRLYSYFHDQELSCQMFMETWSDVYKHRDEFGQNGEVFYEWLIEMASRRCMYYVCTHPDFVQKRAA
jgi:hypothetical protein